MTIKDIIRTGVLRALAVIALMAVAVSCSDEEGPALTSTTFSITAPSGVEGMSITSQSVMLKNLTTGLTSQLTDLSGAEIEEGLYDISYTAAVTYTVTNQDGEAATVEGTLTGSESNVVIKGSASEVSIETNLQMESDDFIFEEIFFTGTRRASGSSYIGDGYFKIYNNTDHVLYADGLAFCESKFKSTQYYEYTPDIRKDTMAIWSIYVIPGSGHDHPVLPGHSLIICDTGIDHRKANSNSFDLSAADFEWYDESNVPSTMDIDSETVPNLDKWYCYTNSIYVLHNRGFTSFALARIPVSKEDYLANYLYDYNYTIYTAAGTYPMRQQCYKLPNAWIVDGVNCSVESSRLWNLLPPTVDAGWTHCGKIDKDETRFFRSVRRKMLSLNADGTMKLKDTNNSTEDFNTECIPSVIEAQHTAIDYLGTKATTETYDGVQPKK